MNWFKYFADRGYPVRKLSLQWDRAAICIQCSEWFGDSGSDAMMELMGRLEKSGYQVTIGPVKGSWAEAHWDQLMDYHSIQKDDLPF